MAMASKRTSRRQIRRNSPQDVASLVARLYAASLDAADDRVSGRSDRWLDREVEQIARGLFDAGLTAKQTAQVVVSAFEAAATHQRRRMVANRRLRSARLAA